MVLRTARVTGAPWDDALLEFLRRVDGSNVRWWFYGSVALAVRRIQIEPGDIDINVSDAAPAGGSSTTCWSRPYLDIEGWVARHSGRAFYKAIIEWLSDPHPENDDLGNSHEQGPFVTDHRESVEWRGHRVRIPPLSAQLAACEQRGLDDRLKLIAPRYATSSTCSAGIHSNPVRTYVRAFDGCEPAPGVSGLAAAQLLQTG
jgi:hypothetical protein